MDRTKALTARDAPARRMPKMSELVALEIIQGIVADGLMPGDRLPSEAEMLSKYRVSRSSLREALRLLEVQGLLSIRPGPGSGTIVGRAHPGNLARTLTLYLHMAGSTYDELLDAWIATEPLMARLASENGDREGVEAALTPFLAVKTANCAVSDGLDFHRVVSDLAINPVLQLVLTSINQIVSEHVVNNIGKRDFLESRTVHDHHDIAAAIIRQDGAAASTLMEQHIRHVVEDFRNYWPRRVGDKITSAMASRRA